MLAAFKFFLQNSAAHLHPTLLARVSAIVARPTDLMEQTRSLFIQILRDDHRAEKLKLFEFLKKVFPTRSFKVEELTEEWVNALFQSPTLLTESSKVIKLDVFKSTTVRDFADRSFKGDYERGGINVFFPEDALPSSERCVETFIRRLTTQGLDSEFAWALLALFSQTEYGVFNIAFQNFLLSLSAFDLLLLGHSEYDQPIAFAVNGPDKVQVTLWKPLISPTGNIFLSATVCSVIDIEKGGAEITVTIKPQLYVWDENLRKKLQPFPVTPAAYTTAQTPRVNRLAQLTTSASSALRSATRRAFEAFGVYSAPRPTAAPNDLAGRATNRMGIRRPLFQDTEEGAAAHPSSPEKRHQAGPSARP